MKTRKSLLPQKGIALFIIALVVLSGLGAIAFGMLAEAYGTFKVFIVSSAIVAVAGLWVVGIQLLEHFRKPKESEWAPALKPEPNKVKAERVLKELLRKEAESGRTFKEAWTQYTSVGDNFKEVSRMAKDHIGWLYSYKGTNVRCINSNKEEAFHFAYTKFVRVHGLLGVVEDNITFNPIF